MHNTAWQQCIVCLRISHPSFVLFHGGGHAALPCLCILHSTWSHAQSKPSIGSRDNIVFVKSQQQIFYRSELQSEEDWKSLLKIKEGMQPFSGTLCWAHALAAAACGRRP